MRIQSYLNQPPIMLQDVNPNRGRQIGMLAARINAGKQSAHWKPLFSCDFLEGRPKGVFEAQTRFAVPNREGPLLVQRMIRQSDHRFTLPPSTSSRC
jgi:hypothetical protein